jgi:cardiolipin synthase A/B
VFKPIARAFLPLLLLIPGMMGCVSPHRAGKQESLNEWRTLTSSDAPPPRVFVKGEQVQFYFPAKNGVEAFKSAWKKIRIPAPGYRVREALLRWDQRLSRIPEPERGWREAKVISGAEWRALATNLIEELTPRTSGHGVYYQAFLAEGLLYRDARNRSRFVPLGDQPADIVIEHQFSIEETLEQLARLGEAQLARTHPRDSLFLIMAPNARRFTQPVLIDRQQRRCILLMPSALYDFTERGVTPSATAQGLSAILPESHGIALLKNPISSAFRLVDLGVETAIRFLRLPLPKPAKEPPPLSNARSMNPDEWEAWLDSYTGTRLEDGELDLLIDGERFFTRFEQALGDATNHIFLNIYIFDRDDVAVEVADLLKLRSSDVEVRVLLDRMGSIGAGQVPPATPLPEHFTPPPKITDYLTTDSRVRVRKFLNPWFSSNHAKVLLVDGADAWLGGMNFGREYRYEWHDLMVELHGPVVASLEDEFKRAWAHAGPWGDIGYAAALLKKASPKVSSQSERWIKVRRLPTRTAWKPFATAVSGAFRRAQNHIYIENPYLFDKRAILALVRARNRGVDVRVVLPRVNDFKAGGRGNLVVANYLFEHGVRVFFYPGMTHVKAIQADGWTCLGSGNLNHLSLRLNQEQNIATSDPEFAARANRDLFEADFARSYEMKAPITVDWVDFLADFLLEGF